MKESREFRCAVLADFNVENFNRLLANSPGVPSVEVLGTPYQQTVPLLLNDEARCWEEADCAVVWTLPDVVSPTFSSASSYEGVEHRDALDEVDAFCDKLLLAASRVETLIVPNWVLPPSFRGYGPLDLEPGVGIRDLLARMNLALADRLREHGNIFLLDSSRWIASVRGNPFPPKLWYMAKTKFANDVFRAAVDDVRALLRGIAGDARKLLVVDLDDTLWGGILGDVGLEGLRLGGHDPVGEALVDFQRALKALTRRGILLGVVSKNDEDFALRAISEHPEMVLDLDDLAGWRINWQDKAANLVALVDEVNLGLDATVFIDDNPVERDRVREAFPDVLVPEWPEDKTLYVEKLHSLDCFDVPSLSSEDRRRASMYTVERKRRSLKQEVPSVDDWLASLDTTVTVEPLNDANLPRAAQLLNKTNQMNLSTRRMPENELWAWASEATRRFWTFRVTDRFGDLGLTGLASLEWSGDEGRIVDFILSCRVMGRKVEEAMLSVVHREASDLGLERITAVYRPTDRNGPCRSFLESSVLTRDVQDEHRFHLQVDEPVSPPEQVQVEDAEEFASSTP